MENQADPVDSVEPLPAPTGWIKSEDWLAVILGCLVLAVALGATLTFPAKDYADHVTQIDNQRSRLKQLEMKRQSTGGDAARKEIQSEKDKLESLNKEIETEKGKLESLSRSLFQNPLKPWLAKIGSWNSNPADAFFNKKKQSVLPGLFGVMAVGIVLFSIGIVLQGGQVLPFASAFVVIFLLATLSYILAGQNVIKYYNLEYALWALLIGMVISNTLGTPRFLNPAIRTELYIKTGLVLLGAEILLTRLIVLGLPGIFVSWVVTPITLITTYVFGQYVLRMESKALNMVICADMSVCGVSAAIATGAACRAKKEELSLAIGISLAFTAIMMVVMPMFIKVVGMSEVLGGAWLGGTIDSTGAVAAAGGMLGPTALEVATTVKMIQNILIGVVAFGVAVYWVMYVEHDASAPRPGVMEIWYRFPKFVFGFVGASIVFSAIYFSGTAGTVLTEAVIGGTSEILRGWFFCLAFVTIGLETNFRELSKYMKGGKPLVLYVCGQTLNLSLTLFMAWIMFEKVFPQAAAVLQK